MPARGSWLRSRESLFARGGLRGATFPSVLLRACFRVSCRNRVLAMVGTGSGWLIRSSFQHSATAQWQRQSIEAVAAAAGSVVVYVEGGWRERLCAACAVDDDDDDDAGG